MSDGHVEVSGHQDQVARLAVEIAAHLAAEPRSEITAHLARVAARQAAQPDALLEAARGELDAAPGVPEDPGAIKARGALAEAVAQLAGEVAAQRRALEAVLTVLTDSFRPATHHHPDLEGELDALHDRFATAERSRTWAPTDLDLITRLEALERARRDDEAQR